MTLPLPVVLIGTDTPQVTPALLAAAAEPLVSRTADATFGMAEDGGFWLLGLRWVDPDLILGVQDVTGRHRRPPAGPARAGLAGASPSCPNSPMWTRSARAQQVAALTPGSRFADCMARLREGVRQPVAVGR